MNYLRWMRMVSCVLLIHNLPGQTTVTDSPREPKYQRLSQFKIGRLSFSDVRVDLVAVRQEIDQMGRETVPTLNLSQAHISLIDDDGKSLLAGDLAESSRDDPAGKLSGTFAWN